MSTDTSIRAYQEEDQQQVIALWELVFPDEPSWNDPATLIDCKLSTRKNRLRLKKI